MTDVETPQEDAPTWRERQREATRDEIKAIARTHLTQHGAAALSLRSIARDLGMVVSALYRYFPGRDELLTALIIDAYDDLATVVEAALQGQDGNDPEASWIAVTTEFRRWALEHRGEYALVFGTPVPGYNAPDDTMDPAMRFFAALTEILVAAERNGYRANEYVVAGNILDAKLSALSEMCGHAVRGETMLAGQMMWTFLVGSTSLELFGHVPDEIDDAGDMFTRMMVAQCRATLIRPN